MKNGFVKVAVVSPSVRVADCDYNADQIILHVEQCYAQGAKLVVFPELCVTGATCGVLFTQESLLKKALTALQKILNKTAMSDSIIVIGMPLSVHNAVYNCSVVLQAGNILAIIPKVFGLGEKRTLNERFFTSAPSHNAELSLLGRQVPFGRDYIFSCRPMPAFTFGVLPYSSLLAPFSPAPHMYQHGTSLFVVQGQEPISIGSCEKKQRALCTISELYACACIHANAGSGESTAHAVYGGGNCIIENGEILAKTLPFEESSVMSEVDLAFLSKLQRERMAELNANQEKYIYFDMQIELTNLTRTYVKNPFTGSVSTSTFALADEAITIQANALKKRMLHSQANKAVIGVSGGLDSTLALLVCAKAADLMGVPRDTILAVTMPCFGTTKRTKSNAEKLCEELGIVCREVDVSASVSQHLKDLGHADAFADTAFENAQARERTQVLMDLANMEGGIVVGTGDLSEIALGWSTYNGDHMSMYCVNAGIPKTMMREMLLAIATRASDGLRRTLLDILDTPISPELLPTDASASPQETESIIGPYELHDFFIYHMIYGGATKEKVQRLAEYAFSDIYGAETISKWLDVFHRRFFSQQFKRSCSPDGPLVGKVFLSSVDSWQMVSDATSAAW